MMLLPYKQIDDFYRRPLAGSHHPQFAAIGRAFDALYPKWYENKYEWKWMQVPERAEFGTLCHHELLGPVGSPWSRRAREHLYNSQKIDGRNGKQYNTACDGGPLELGVWMVGEVKLFVEGLASFNSAQMRLIDLLREDGRPYMLYAGNLVKTGYNDVHDQFEEDAEVEVLPFVDLTDVELEQYTLNGQTRYKMRLDQVC